MSSRLVNFLRLLRRVIVGRTDRETRHAQIDYVGSGIYRVYTCCRRSWGRSIYAGQGQGNVRIEASEGLYRYYMRYGL